MSLVITVQLKEVEAFKVEAAEIIKTAEQRIHEIQSLLPFSQMTYEDASYVQPELVLDMENKPSFWPHSEIDYVFEEPASETEKIEEQKKIDGAH